MNYEDALRKIAKLLKLAKSSNVNEAAAAAAQAQALMDTYRIEAEVAHTYDVDGNVVDDAESEEIVDPIEALDTFGARAPSWKGRLALTIAKANQCFVFKDSATRSLRIVGRENNIGIVRYLYAYLVREVERITKIECKGTSRTYRNNFRLGAVETLGERLREQAANTREEALRKATAVPDSRALVRVETAIKRIEQHTKEVEAYAYDKFRLRTKSIRYRADESARAHGRRVARDIDVSRRSRGALSAG